MSGTARSLALLSERVAAIPEGLEADLQQRPFELPATLRAARRWVATGTGGSEGPARALVAALQQRGIPARFSTLSSFALGDPVGDAALVVFSQGLSPNARLALSSGAPTLIVTSVDPAASGERSDTLRAALARGAALLRHGPSDESKLLVRVGGPARATLAAFRVAEQLGAATAPPASLPAAVRRLLAAPPPALDDRRVALVCAGDAVHYAHGLRWKLLEALGIPDPPTWDVLQLAHGPLQQFHPESITLLCLEHNDAERRLFDRLERVVVPERHQVVRLSATLPHPFGWFEHDAQLNGMILASLRRRPRDLIDWPGKGNDADLYDLDRRSLFSVSEP